jgi:hypothetical protein
MKQEARVLAIGLAIFALYLPVAIFVGLGYVPVPRPAGAGTETILKIAHHSGFQYHTHSIVMAKHAGNGATVMLYEGLTALGPANFVKFTDDPRSFVVFSASDNSDPRTNGRHYWLVLP